MKSVWLVQLKADRQVLGIIAYEKGQKAEEVLDRWFKWWVHEAIPLSPPEAYTIDLRVITDMEEMTPTMPDDA